MKRRDFIRGCAAGGAVALFRADLFAAALAADGTPKTLILGGGVFALGCALARPRETLVLVRGIHLGADIALTCGPHAVGSPTTPLGKKLYDALVAEGLVKNGELELPPLADFLSAFFAAQGGQAFLGAELADLAERSTGWKTTVFGSGSEGFSSFEVARFVDTTDRAWRDRGVGDVTGVRFGALTHKGYFTVDLPPSVDWHAARIAFRRAWDASGEQGEPLAEVNALSRMYGPRRVERMFACGGRRYPWIPSAQFPTLLSAFEEGLKWNAR